MRLLIKKNRVLYVQKNAHNIILFFRLLNMPFEKAYCLYRLNQLTESESVLKGIEDPGLKEKELLAQVVSINIRFSSIYIYIYKNIQCCKQNSVIVSYSIYLRTLIGDI